MSLSLQIPKSPGLDEAGFTLIESLVALTILALSATPLIGAAELHIRRITDLEERAIAQWVAENALVTTRLSGAPPEAQPVSMLGIDWIVTVSLKPTEQPELASVTILVSKAHQSESPVVFSGFADVGGIRQ